MKTFFDGFFKQASFRSKLLDALMSGREFKLKGHSKRGLRNTVLGKKLWR